MVPKVREVAVRLRDSGTRILKARDHLIWKDVDGLIVPESIRRDRVTFYSGDDDAIPFENADDTHFVWHRVNRDFEDSFFTLESFLAIEPSKFLALEGEK